MNQPIPVEAALEAVIQAFASAESATGETAPVSPEAGPLETPFPPTSEVAPEAAGINTSEVASEAAGAGTSAAAPEAPVVCTPKETNGDAPMASATTSTPGKAEREREATDRSANAVDTHFHLDRLARTVRRKKEQGKSMSLASVLANVFRPKQPPIHAMHLQYAVASFCDPEFHLRLDRGPQKERLRDVQNDPRLRFGFGVHPKHATGFCRRLDTGVDRLRQLMSLPGVVAFGEVG